MNYESNKISVIYVLDGTSSKRIIGLGSNFQESFPLLFRRTSQKPKQQYIKCLVSDVIQQVSIHLDE